VRGGDDNEIGLLAIGDISLRAVEQPMIAAIHRRGFYAGQI
jgi:hypothetical protein